MGLAGGSKSLGTSITKGLLELLELKVCLPDGLKQLLEVGVILQVVQTGADLVQRGVLLLQSHHPCLLHLVIFTVMPRSPWGPTLLAQGISNAA